MKNYRIVVMIAVLVFASLACRALTGGGNDSSPAPSSSDGHDIPSSSDPSAPPSNSDPGSGGGGDSDYEFPVTKDAFNVTPLGEGSLLYYTKMSQEDVMKFYRDEYAAMGYTERELLTTVSEGVFSMVFDGDPSGKAIVIQSVDLGDGSSTVAIRLEDV